jgi:hypothetical protein
LTGGLLWTRESFSCPGELTRFVLILFDRVLILAKWEMENVELADLPANLSNEIVTNNPALPPC